MTINNPLLGNTGLPHFGEINATHVVPAVTEVLREISSRFAELERSYQPTWQGLLAPLAELSMHLHHTWSPVTHLNGVANSPELRAAYEEVQGPVVELSLKIYQSEALYQGMKAIQTGPEWQHLNSAQKRVLTQKIQAAEQAGIGLKGDKRKEFNELTHELTQLSTQFANNVLDSTKSFYLVLEQPEQSAGLPPSFLSMAAQAYQQKFPESAKKATAEKGPWLVTLDYPSFVPFMENSKSRDLREKLYKAYISRAASEPFDNRETMRRILQIRKRQAELLGYPSYAALSLSRKMAGSVDDVYKLENELLQAAWKPALQELADLEALAKKQGQTAKLAQWDSAFWAKRLQEERFCFTDEDLRPYFALPRVLEGLFQVVHKLFGITVQSADGEAPVWHPDVRFFKIFDSSNEHLASFYLDPYSRPENKRGGAWMDECLPRYLSPTLIKPVAYLVCNSTPPVAGEPSLMTFREVETLFHEFGHGLQLMLTQVDELEAAGISGIEWDAIELPSQFMENWCYHKPTLMQMARHYQNDTPMPDELFDKLLAAKTFRAGQIMLRQIQFGLLDLTLHDSYDPFDDSKSPFELQKEVAEKTSVMPLLPEDYFLCAFTHIFSGGYAAGYFSYKWAEVLSADAFGAFEEADMNDEAELARIGGRFRSTILAKGGSEHPLEIFKSFRGREPSSLALLRHSGLVSE